MVWAIVRPDLKVILVESMQRRVDFQLAVEGIGLADRVDVVRGRAEDLVGAVSGDVVTARAVAPMGHVSSGGWHH